MKLVSTLIFLTVAASFSQAKKWEMCELARHLHFSHGFSRETLPDWMCIIKYESDFNSHLFDGEANRARYWGLWRISDAKWCGLTGLKAFISI